MAKTSYKHLFGYLLDPVAGVRALFGEAFKRRFSLYLTFEGWCLVVAMLLIGFAAINTAAPLLYLVFSMMCAFFVISAFLATNTMKGLMPRRVLPRVWNAQEPARVGLAVHNRKLVSASHSLRVEDITLAGARAGGAFFERVPPRGEAFEEYQCVFPRRGVHRLQQVRISTRFPFGLIERTLVIDHPEEVVVLPQWIPLGREMERARVELGDYEAQRMGHGAGIYGFREYAPELSARDIHWKVSARRGQLIAREYESEEKRRGSVVLDNRQPAEVDDRAREAFEKAIVLATSVLRWLCDQEHEFELRTASGRVEFGSGPSHLTRCRRALATVILVDEESAEPRLLRPSESGSVEFPISAFGRVSGGHGVVAFSVADFDERLTQALKRRVPVKNGESRPAPLDSAALAALGGRPA